MGSVLPPDNHVHTQWSWDAPAEASMVRSCEQALAAGVPAVAFTDHLDFTVSTDGDLIAAEHIDPRPYAAMRLLDVPGYLASVQECRERFPDLRILTGAEIGEAHLWAASARAVVARAGFDRILGSLHAIPFDGKLTASDVLFCGWSRAATFSVSWRIWTSRDGCGRGPRRPTTSGPSSRRSGPCCAPWRPAGGSSR
jgi:hypothetical protein